MNKAREKYTVVIGLEMHAQLSTKSKIYASDANSYGDSPNTNVSEITLAHPGSMPKLNKKVLDYAIKMGIACNSDITRYNIFCRKNYFYPDLPKGFQLTQDKTPICIGGYIPIVTSDERHLKISLNRIHIEEDAGKSIHLEGEQDTLIDLNRAGTPLIEIVTEPDVRSSEEAGLVFAEVRKLVRFLGICDGNMEKGSLRCDANVSIMPKNSTKYGQKVELKNMNSIRYLRDAIEHEVDRQVAMLEKGEKVFSETRTYNPDTGKSTGMRLKEELNDYRYFPEPDLSPVVVTDEWLDEIKREMPELPEALKKRFMEQYGLSEYDAMQLSAERNVSDLFDETCNKSNNYKAVANWMMGPVKTATNERGIEIDELELSPAQLAEIIALIDQGSLNFSIASQQLFALVLENPTENVAEIAAKHHLILENDEDELKKIVEQVLEKHPKEIKAYQNGKKQLLGMFMGQVMKSSQGKADPKITNKLLRELLEK